MGLKTTSFNIEEKDYELLKDKAFLMKKRVSDILRDLVSDFIKIEKIDSNSIKIATDNNKSLDILKNISGNFIQELNDINIENISMDDVIRKIYQK